MKKITLILSSIFIFFSFYSSSIAKDIKEFNIRAGKKTLVYRFAVFTKRSNCDGGSYAQFRDRKTKHGKLTSARGSIIAPEGECKGRRYKSTDIYYTPDPGFRGVDNVRITLTFPAYTDSTVGTKSSSVRYKFNVK